MSSMKCVIAIVVLTMLLQAWASSVHLCSCLGHRRSHHNVTNRGCDPGIRLQRLQIGRITSPGKIHFKFKVQLERALSKPHVDFTLVKLISLPCMGGFGSCSYSLCGHEHFAIENEICTGWGCTCPLQAGIYHSGLVSIDMPDLRALGPAAYGPVNVKMKLHEGGKVIHCARFKIHVVFPSNATETSRADGNFEPSPDMIDALT